MPPTDARRFTLRLPADLAEQLKRAARENRRSLNAEIEYRLMKSLQTNPPT